MSDLDNALKALSATRVPSLLEQKNERLRLAMEMIFREIVFNMLATSENEVETMRWMQREVESILSSKYDADEAEASGENGHG